MSVNAMLQKIPGLGGAVRFAKNRVYDAWSVSALRQERMIRRQGTIKVGFLCQFIPAWTKVEGIYQMMLSDERFEPYLICLPSGIKGGVLEDPQSLENDTYEYFLSHGYSEAINALVGKDTWFDLKELGLSYVFYPRPYNSFMPAPYTSRQVSRYAKICLLIYGIEITEEITATTLNRNFMSNVAYYFAENSAVRDTNIRNNRLGHKLGLQQTLCIGLPVLESLCKKRDELSPSWEFSQNNFRVLWTPRWTTDLSLGGSNFFTYYKELPRYAREHPDADFLFRPHPLAFSHFIETGEMTEEEVEEFKAGIDAMPNVSLDKEQQYDATLWGASVLVSDYSGMMPEYFITGKPLIFCASNMHLKLSQFGRQLVDGCYVVNNAQELRDCLDMLRRGEDPMKEKRQQILREVYGSTNEGATQRILDTLAKDVH